MTRKKQQRNATIIRMKHHHQPSFVWTEEEWNYGVDDGVVVGI
jgi:hypothetical protein